MFVGFSLWGLLTPGVGGSRLVLIESGYLFAGVAVLVSPDRRVHAVPPETGVETGADPLAELGPAAPTTSWSETSEELGG
jgi:hypothetical protein